MVTDSTLSHFLILVAGDKILHKELGNHGPHRGSYVSIALSYLLIVAPMSFPVFIMNFHDIFKYCGQRWAYVHLIDKETEAKCESNDFISFVIQTVMRSKVSACQPQVFFLCSPVASSQQWDCWFCNCSPSITLLPHIQSYLTSFLTYKMGIIIVSTSQDCCGD